MHLKTPQAFKCDEPLNIVSFLTIGVLIYKKDHHKMSYSDIPNNSIKCVKVLPYTVLKFSNSIGLVP